LSHFFEVRPKVKRRTYGTLILPLIFLAVAFGQIGGTGTAPGTNEDIQFVSMFSSDNDVYGNLTPCQRVRDVVDRAAATSDVSGERPTVCDQVLDIVAGKANSLPANIAPILAARVAVDSRMRVLITEPATQTVHILDFVNRKYSRIDGAKGDRMHVPYGIAVDADNNIYVTDLERKRIAVYNADGKFKKYIGRFKDEGEFELPRSIAIDRATGRIYLADTARNFVLILDLDGKTLAEVGKRGGGNGPAEFMEPTEVALYGNEVFVLDRRNERIQVLDLGGHFRRQFKLGGSGTSDANGMAFDTQGRLFVPSLSWVEVFNREGKLLFRFGQSGERAGEFNLTKGVCTDSKDRVYVMDSGNHRIQVFQVTDQPKSITEASQ
jgi:DNA-binding beta-propeller fold protein YncE